MTNRLKTFLVLDFSNYPFQQQTTPFGRSKMTEPVFKYFPNRPSQSNDHVKYFRNHIGLFLVSNWEILKIENSNKIRY